jgi:arsenite methyltransferase
MFTSVFLRFLNWEASLSKNNPQRMIENLQIREGRTIADIGSGGGYFTLEFARKVGKSGRVYAVDMKLKYLDFIKNRSKMEGLDNIIFLQATGDELNLPEAGLDLVFLRNVFHHLPEPEKYFHNLKRFLKSTGKVAIIEPKLKSRFSFIGMFKHYTPLEVMLEKMERAGYFQIASFDFLPSQTFSLFEVR